VLQSISADDSDVFLKSVYTIQPVLKPVVRLDVCLHDAAGCPTGCTIQQTVVKPVWQRVVSCKRGFRRTELLQYL